MRAAKVFVGVAVVCLVEAALAAPTASGYASDPILRAEAERVAAQTPTKAKHFKVNLDLEPEERWADVASHFKEEAKAITAYIEQFIPKFIMPVVDRIAASLESHFPDEYSREMRSFAKFYDIPLGEVVIVNLIYQVEKLENNCSASNNTGPCPPKDEGPGLCTSIVAETAEGGIVHGRNLDWDIPAALRALMADIEYTKSGKTLFIASQPVGFVGVLHGTVPDVISYSMDARDKGGNPELNLIEVALSKKALTPTQHARTALTRVAEGTLSFEDGLEIFAGSHLTNPAYYILGGTKSGEAAVLTRDRNNTIDTWRPSEQPSSSDYFLLQTNYDHWKPVPSYDDRRDPGNAHMKALGRSGVSTAGVLGVLKQWPTFNHHTDFTGMISASEAENYQTLIWPFEG